MKHIILSLLFLINLQPAVRAQHETDSLIIHFWDSISIEEYMSLDQQTELISYVIDEMPAFMELLSGHTSAAHIAEAYSSVMTKAEEVEAEALWYCMRDMAEDYFHSPNSAFRNDDIYIFILEKLSESRYMSESDSLRYGFQLKMMKKNRIGSFATDLDLRIDKIRFPVRQKGDKPKSRYKIKLSEICSDSTIVLFYDPACEHCLHQIEAFRNDEHIVNLCKQDSLRMIFINIEPKSKYTSGWKNIKTIPERWVFATDYKRAVIKKHAYYLPFVPQLYILGKNMKIVGREW